EGSTLVCKKGTSSPALFKRYSRVCFQGQILLREPSIIPVKSARVTSWNRLSIQLRKWEMESKPTTQPQAKTKRTEKCRDFTAARMGAYIPMTSRIKLPEIPGRIIAQMAIIPLKKRVKRVTSISRGDSSVII